MLYWVHLRYCGHSTRIGDILAKQNKPTFAKMKSRKRKGRVSCKRTIVVCGGNVCLDNESIMYMREMEEILK